MRVQPRRKILTSRRRVARRIRGCVGRRAVTSGTVLTGMVSSASPPTLSSHRVATATASHRRAARSGLVMWVRCHCQPARLVILKPCSIQARKPYQQARKQATTGQHEARPRPWDRPVHLTQHAQPLPPPGMFGGGGQDDPDDWDSTAAIDHAEHQDGKAGAQGGRIEGQGQLGALPQAHDPGQQGQKAGLDAEGAAVRPAFGRSFVAELAQLLAHGILFAAQPRGQERTDGGQGTRACQDHAQTPQRQHRGLGLAQVGHVRLDGLRPFGDTRVARHTFPPRMYGIYRYPYNTCWEAWLAILPSGEKHHRLKNLPQKAAPPPPVKPSEPEILKPSRQGPSAGYTLVPGTVLA